MTKHRMRILGACLFLFGAAAAVLALAHFGHFDHKFGKSAQADREVVLAALIEQLKDDNPHVVQNMKNILWHPSDYYYSDIFDYSFPAGKDAATAFGKRFVNLGNSLLVTNGSRRRSTVDWDVIFADEGREPDLRENILYDAGEADVRNLEALWEDVGTEKIRFVYFDRNIIHLTSASSITGATTTLVFVCKANIAFRQFPDEETADDRTASSIRVLVFSDDYRFWLQDRDLEPDLVTAGLNHCFLMTMGLPNTSSADQLTPIFEATRAALACARKDGVYRPDEAADTLAERLLAACGDVSAER